MSMPLLTKIDSLLSQDPNFVLHLTAFVSEWEAKQEPPKEGEGLTSGLTPSQVAAFNAMVDFIHSEDQFFRLEGYAGTGKSFTVVRFLSYLLAQKLTFCVAAPTNKAVRNIANMVSRAGLLEGFPVVTLAKLLGQLPEINVESGKEEFVQKKDVAISVYDVILIDEFSMIDKDTLSKLIEENPNKVIFIGDPAQLPPIGEKVTEVMTHPEIKSGATLREIVRYEGDIAKVAEMIRSEDRYKSQIFRFNNTPDQSIVLFDRFTWQKKAAELFKSDDWLRDPDHCRIIAWTNRSVNGLNQTMRNMIYGDVPEFITGELLIAKSPLFRRCGDDWTVYADNREEFTIVSTPRLVPFGSVENTFVAWEIQSLSSQDGEKTLYVLNAESARKQEKELQALAKQAKEEPDRNKRRKLWGRFYDIKKRFDDVTYAMALTAHSAQGSSLDHVFLFASEMGRCNERQQILYTSLTRTKTRCYVCQ